MSFPITRFAPTAGPQGPSVYPRGYIDGLILSNAADADHDITVAAGACRDSTNVTNMDLAAAITKQIDTGWAAGNNAGGLDTGAVGNATWYHVFLIRKDSDGSIDALFSTSATTPTMPAGYTYKRRIGSVLTNGSANILAFTQIGDYFRYTVRILDADSVAGSNPATLRTVSVPTGINVEAVLLLKTTSATVNDYCGLTDAIATSTSSIRCVINVSNIPFWLTGRVMTNTSAQVLEDSIDSDVVLNIYTNGWIDPRGKDA